MAPTFQPLDMESQQILKEYQTQFEKMLQPQPLSSIQDLLSPQTKPPLIQLAPDQDAWSVMHNIKQRLGSTQQYLYIHRPIDLQRYYKTYILKKGSRQRIKGPLYKLIEDETKCALIINWNNFNAEQIATYKSLLDTKPTLFGEKIPETMKVIGLTSTSNANNAAFLSRCKRWFLSDEFFELGSSRSIDAPSPAQSKKPIEVDLFNRAAWREILFGKITVNGHKIILKESPLVEAINNHRPLVIYNPPDDPEFDALMNRINIEHRIFYNGEMLEVPAETTVTLNTKSHPNRLDNVELIVRPISKIDSISRIFHISVHNLHECLQQLKIDNATKAAQTIDGFLKQATSGDVCYVLPVTGAPHDWTLWFIKDEASIVSGVTTIDGLLDQASEFISACHKNANFSVEYSTTTHTGEYGMTMREFIRQNRADLDNCIDAAIYRHDGNGGRGIIPDPPPTRNDSDRRQWILNDESLYQWARSEGVRI